MTPGDVLRFANFADDSRQNRVSQQAVGLVVFARIDIRLARITGGIDQAVRFFLFQGLNQFLRMIVIQFASRKIAERDSSFLEDFLKSLSDVTTSAE